MSAFIDMTGKKIGNWTVIKHQPVTRKDGKKLTYWLCSCICGTIRPVLAGNLRFGVSNSCGCISKAAGKITHGATVGYRKEGKLKLPKEVRVWYSMKYRCYNPKVWAYQYYGARGITVCDSWKNDFNKFLEDMGPCPPGYSIERIDVNGNYCPENCKWILLKEQNKNKRNTIK